MNAIIIILAILLFVLMIFLIGAILLQSGSKAGLGAISGAAESFYSKGKSKTIDNRLALITKIIVFLVIGISVAFIFMK